MKKTAFTALLRQAVAAPLVALAILAAVLLWQIQSSYSSMQWVDHSDQAISANWELVKLIIDMETGLRGYLETGGDEFLEPYNQAKPVIYSKFDNLNQLVSENPSQQARLAAIRNSFDQWRTSADQAIEPGRRSANAGYDSALQRKQLMDSIRAQANDFRVVEEQLRNERVQSSQKTAKQLIVVCTLLTLGVGVLLAIFTRQRMRLLGTSFQESLSVAEKRANELREQANLLDVAHDTIMTLGLDGQIRFWNHGAEEMYGYSKQVAVSRNSHELLRTVFPKPLPEIEAEILHEGRWEGELVHTTRDGTQITVASRWVLQHDDSGQASGVMEINNDITQRKHAEEALRRSEERLQRQNLERAFQERLALALKAGQSGTFEWDIQNNVNIWSPELEELYGLKTGEFAGTYEDWESLVFPDDLETARAAIQTSMKTGEFVSEWRIKRSSDGEIRWLSARAKVLLEHGQPIRMRGINADITDRKLAEQEISRMNAELEDRVAARTAELSSTMKELEAFTYSVSHDLRAPLRQVNGFAKLLVEELGPGLSETAKEYLTWVQHGARNMGQLIDDLLNLSRVGRRELCPQLTALNTVVREVIDSLSPEIQDREIEWQFGDLPFVECDPALMKQVWVNLLSNAIKFTGPRKPARIEVGQTICNGQTVIFVRDNGVGFSMKYADKLFGAFQRLHRAEDFPGTGIGLATVQRIIHKHGGRIWADAELDKGATFYFTLAPVEDEKTKKEESFRTEVQLVKK